MARPTRCRRICMEPAYGRFRPKGIPTDENVNTTLDEYEAIRLIDLNKCTHEQCAQQMGISRTTVTEIYEFARYKLADSVVHGKILSISGGNLLAASMRKKGYSTAVLDADITGPSIPKIFGLSGKAQTCESGIFLVESENGTKIMSVNLLLDHETDPVIWRGPLIAGTVKQFWTDVYWGAVDYMFVDMPPGTGDVPLTVFQSVPVDGIIVVTSTQDLVGMIVGKAVKMAEMMHIPVIGIVENMAYYECRTCHDRHYIFGKSDIAGLADTYHIGITAQIPINPSLAEACDKGKIEEYKTDYLNQMIEKI